MLKFQHTGELSATLGRLKNVRVIVVGDAMLDRYVSGDANRISPEAPVPVVLVESETYRAGGAANVAMNLASMGVQTALFSTLGNDTSGKTLAQILATNGVSVTECCHRENLRTIVKARVVARTQQICRIDYEDPPRNYAFELNSALLLALEQSICHANAVILSDYAKGVVTQELYNHLHTICSRHGILLAVDPKPSRKIDFQSAGLMTPNRKEAMELADMAHAWHEPRAEEQAAKRIYERYHTPQLVITLGQEGMLVVDNGEIIARLPTEAQEVFDVSGAGDTVIAAIVAALASGSNLIDAARFGNIAAGIVVGKFGTAVPTRDEIARAIDLQAIQASSA